MEHTKTYLDYKKKANEKFDVDASYQGDDVEVIEFEAEFENYPTKLEISKTDITGEHELKGAKLSIIDANGNVVYSWESDGTVHVIDRIPVGNPILSILDENADVMEEYQVYSEIIRENIELDVLLQRNPFEQETIQGIFDLILETVISKKATMMISGQEYPMNLVKSKFLKLNSSHIEYVLGCFGKNTTKVHNIKSYLLASVFNAGSTMSSFYRAEVNHDMPQFAK